jgi:hypothetical protein
MNDLETARKWAKEQAAIKQEERNRLAMWGLVVVGVAVVLGGLWLGMCFYPTQTILACVFVFLTAFGVFLNGTSWGAPTSQPQAPASKLNPVMVCPHCQNKGVLTEKVMRKKGVSGAKATAGLLTGGISLLAVGLSREEQETRCECPKCHMIWHVG